MKLIQNPTSRQGCFYNRKCGLLKKAFELSVLCDAEVALIIFSQTGKIYEFASHDDVNAILAKYRIQTGTTTSAMPSSLQNTEPETLHEKTNMLEKREKLEKLHERINMLEKRGKNMVGENLESLTVDELQQREKQLRKSIRKIRGTKMKVFSRSAKLLPEKVRCLEEEKTELLTKLGTRGHSCTSALESQITLTRGHSSTSAAELSSDEISL